MVTIDYVLKIAADKILAHERVSDELAKERMEICLACEKMDSVSLKCKVCKCFLEVKTTCLINANPVKLRNEITHCPLGKWGDKETANKYRKIDGLEPL